MSSAFPDPAVPGDAPALPERVVLQLRERILSGVLRPGTFLRPDRLAVELGVSPTPVREALQALRADDMVRALPRRGFVVAPLDRGDVVDLFAVQAHLTGEPPPPPPPPPPAPRAPAGGGPRPGGGRAPFPRRAQPGGRRAQARVAGRARGALPAAALLHRP